MQLFDVTTVALERALAGAALRHEVLSANIANADTPGYHRADVDFHSVLARAPSGETSPERVEDVTFSAAIDRSGPVRYDGVERRSRARDGEPRRERARVPGPRRDPPGSRMDVIASNIANTQTTRDVDGEPYRRRQVVLRPGTGLDAVLRGVEVAAIDVLA